MSSENAALGAPAPWAIVAGFVTAAVTLLFFMGLVFAAIFGHQVPCGSRFIVVIIFALSAAMAASFLGGSAAARGHIPLGGARAHPVAFGVGGGIAVLLIVTVLGSYLYANSECIDAPPLSAITLDLTGRIVDRDGNPISNAKVRASGYADTWETLANGTFRCTFRDLVPGAPIEVSVAAPGHARWTTTVRPVRTPANIGDIRLRQFQDNGQAAIPNLFSQSP